MNLEIVDSVATVGLTLTGAASSWAAVLSLRAAERLELLGGREVAAREAGIEVQFIGRLDSSAPAPRVLVTSDGHAVIVHGVVIAAIDARTDTGDRHPGPHPQPGDRCVARDLALPRRIHRGETLDFLWPGGPEERLAVLNYGPSSTVALSAAYSIGGAGPLEFRHVPLQLCSHSSPTSKEHS